MCASADFAQVDEATLAELGELVPVYEELAQGAKVHLLQSIVSRVLVDMVFGVYFPGLSDEQTQRFRQMERTLSQLGAYSSAVPNSGSSRRRHSDGRTLPPVIRWPSIRCPIFE